MMKFLLNFFLVVICFGAYSQEIVRIKETYKKLNPKNNEYERAFISDFSLEPIFKYFIKHENDFFPAITNNDSYETNYFYNNGKLIGYQILNYKNYNEQLELKYYNGSLIKVDNLIYNYVNDNLIKIKDISIYLRDGKVYKLKSSKLGEHNFKHNGNEIISTGYNNEYKIIHYYENDRLKRISNGKIGSDKSVTEIQYINDKYGNWVKKNIISKEKILGIVVREITYRENIEKISPDHFLGEWTLNGREVFQIKRFKTHFTLENKGDKNEKVELHLKENLLMGKGDIGHLYLLSENELCSDKKDGKPPYIIKKVKSYNNDDFDKYEGHQQSLSYIDENKLENNYIKNSDNILLTGLIKHTPKKINFGLSVLLKPPSTKSSYNKNDYEKLKTEIKQEKILYNRLSASVDNNIKNFKNLEININSLDFLKGSSDGYTCNINYSFILKKQSDLNQVLIKESGNISSGLFSYGVSKTQSISKVSNKLSNKINDFLYKNFPISLSVLELKKDNKGNIQEISTENFHDAYLLNRKYYVYHFKDIKILNDKTLLGEPFGELLLKKIDKKITTFKIKKNRVKKILSKFDDQDIIIIIQ